MFTTSPNMQLPVPSVGQEPGPQYAFDVNSCFSLIDSHNHSLGKGIPINPSGLNINADLTFQNNQATNLLTTQYTAESLPTTTRQAISVAPVSTTNELWYTDSNGVSTQITTNGVVNATAAAIPGESYVAGTFIWTQTQSSLPTTPANFDIGSITIRPNTAATTRGITISPPTLIGPTPYALILPLLPSGTSFLTLDNSGNIVAGTSTTGGITGTNIASATITGSNVASNTISRTNLTAVGQQVSSNVTSFSTANSSPVAVSGATVTITTTGRPVMLMLISSSANPVAGSEIFLSANTSSSETLVGQICFLRGATQIVTQSFGGGIFTSTSNNVIVPPSSFNYLDVIAAGTYTYSVSALVTSTSGVPTINIKNIQLVAYEL
jgi:hypothetical protein